jgi:hypothetical protein
MFLIFFTVLLAVERYYHCTVYRVLFSAAHVRHDTSWWSLGRA